MPLGEIVDLYRAASAYAAVSRVEIFEQNDVVTLVTESLQRDMDRGEMTRSTRTWILDSDHRVIASTPPVELRGVMLRCFNSDNTVQAVIRREGENECLEIWRENVRAVNLNLTEHDRHGKVNTDGEFGRFRFNREGTKVVYVAEDRAAKARSFFTKKDEGGLGEEYRDDWGEQLEGRRSPVVCLYDLEENVLAVYRKEDVSLGAPVFTPEGNVLATGWWNTPLKLGLVFCRNRRNALFEIDISTGDIAQITGGESNVVCAGLSSGRLVYLEGSLYGAHDKGRICKVLDWKTRETSVVVDLQNEFPAGDGFPGIYAQDCVTGFTREGRFVMTSGWGSRSRIISVDLDRKTVEMVSAEEDSAVLLGVLDDTVVARVSRLDCKPYLKIARLGSPWKAVTPVERLEMDVGTRMLSPKTKGSDPDVRFEIITTRPRGPRPEEGYPLIVVPHGGPHSASTNNYSLGIDLFTRLGYSTVLVNYRGSTNYGENSIRCLLGKIGGQDVEDVHLAVETVLESGGVDRNRIHVYGGSHGGFLALHLIGQYPRFYRSCICRNPVVDLGMMACTSDIPDWCWSESGLDFDFMKIGLLDEKEREKMRSVSPVVHIDSVETPVLMLLGAKDRRVPHSQGMLYVKMLRARGAECTTYVYDDNHSLSKVDVEGDALVRTVEWLRAH